MVARIALAALATVVAAGMAVQLHAHGLLDSALDQVRREAAAQGRPSAAAQVDGRAHEQAVDDALRVADLRPGSGGLFVAIGLESRAKRHAEAERLALRATRREPENFSAWLTLGVVRQNRGDRSGAREAYARAGELNPLYRTPR